MMFWVSTQKLTRNKLTSIIKKIQNWFEGDLLKSELVTPIFIILSHVRIQDPNAGEIAAKEKVTVITMTSAKTVCGANSIIGGEMITAGQVK